MPVIHKFYLQYIIRNALKRFAFQDFHYADGEYEQSQVPLFFL
jgi:hypothetical protein